MQFSSEAIKNKIKYLDSIDSRPGLIERVVSSHLPYPFNLEKLKRYWEPGGGSSLFLISTLDSRYFLKVKHHSVFVESRLESEENFNRIPSLENEAHFLSLLNSQHTPEVLFYEERDDHSFLALECLEPFEHAVTRMGATQLLLAWDELESFIRQLYSRGIVHTDLHEANICFRKDKLIVCDFEEARFLNQDVPFESSLDYCGINSYGNVGAFPVETGRGIAGLTCLARLREVFKGLVRERLRNYLEECHFDQSCPFNCDTLQEEDPRIYQSVDLAGLSIAGQRPMSDSRKNVLTYFLYRTWQKVKRPLHHFDLGSNLGTFCFLAAEQPFVAESTGLEAFDRYIEAANSLRFLIDAKKVRFRQFVCGESSFEGIGYAGVEVCTMLSVYHHISSRDAFLSALACHRPAFILAEFATQERYYPERGSVAAEIEYIRERLGYQYAVTLMQSSDYHRPLILFSDETLAFIDRFFMHIAKTRLFAVGMALLGTIGRPKGQGLAAATLGDA